MSGKISWFEVMGQDQAALQAFYGKLFGWTFAVQQTPMGPYGIAPSDQTGVPGGVGQAPAGPGWATFYVSVDDLDQAVAQATALGGRVLMPATALPEVRIAVVADPEGHPVGLSQPRGG